MYRLFGAIAGANRWLGTIELHGLPLDTNLRIFLPLVAFFAWAVAATKGSLAAWLVFASSSLVGLALWHCRLQHGVVFRGTSELAPFHDDGGAGPVAPPDFRASGRFLLWEGDRPSWQRVIDQILSGTRRGDRWFLEVPATLVIHDEDRFAITALLDASRQFLGMSLGDEAGLWTIDGEFGSLERPELGALYLGFQTRPAIRLRFHNPRGRRRTVVLTFDDEEGRRSFASTLKRAAGPNWRGLF